MVTINCRACHTDRSISRDCLSVLKVNGRTTLAWACPCGSHEVRFADVPTLVLLAKAGVGGRTVELKPSPRPDGPPLTEDDLLSFGLAMEATS